MDDPILPVIRGPFVQPSTQAVALTAHADADLPDNKRINHAYSHTALKPLMPILLLGRVIGRKVGKLLLDLIALVAGQS